MRNFELVRLMLISNHLPSILPPPHGLLPIEQHPSFERTGVDNFESLLDSQVQPIIFDPRIQGLRSIRATLEIERIVDVTAFEVAPRLFIMAT